MRTLHHATFTIDYGARQREVALRFVIEEWGATLLDQGGREIELLSARWVDGKTSRELSVAEWDALMDTLYDEADSYVPDDGPDPDTGRDD